MIKAVHVLASLFVLSAAAPAWADLLIAAGGGGGAAGALSPATAATP